MPSQAYPSVNGFECSWADIGVSIDIPDAEELDALDFTAIKWDRSVTVGVRKRGGVVVNTTLGEVDQSASATVSRKSYTRLLRALAAVAPVVNGVKRLSAVKFSILVQHTPVGDDEIYENKLVGCRLLGDADDMAEGPDADDIEITLNPMRVFNLLDGEETSL